MVPATERSAWSTVYRMYEQFAPMLRGSNGEAAADIFSKIQELTREQFAGTTDEGRLILSAGFNLLDAVWKASRT